MQSSGFDHDFVEDSFEDNLNEEEMRNDSVPSAIVSQPQNPGHSDSAGNSPQGLENHYELTFKKQKINGFDQPHCSQKLFGSPSNSDSLHRKSLHGNNFEKTVFSESQTLFLSQLKGCRTVKQICKLFQDLNSSKETRNLINESTLSRMLGNSSMDEITYTKIQTYLNYMILQRTRRQRNSCRLNSQIQKQSESMTAAEKHRCEVLELLTLQLQKKVFVQSLRFLRIKKLCSQMLDSVINFDDSKSYIQQQQGNQNHQKNENEQKETEKYENDKNSHFQNKTEQKGKHLQLKKTENGKVNGNAEQLCENGEQKRNSDNQKSDRYYQKSRLTILCQILSTLANKRVHIAFRKMSTAQTQRQKGKNNKNEKNQYENQQYKNNQNQQYEIYGNEYFKNKHIKQNEIYENNEEQDNGNQYEYDENQEQGDQQWENRNQDPVEAIYSYIFQLRRQMIADANDPHSLLRNCFIRWKVFFLKNMIAKIQQEEVEEPTATAVQRTESDADTLTEFASQRKNKNDLKEQKHSLRVFLSLNRKNQFFRCFEEMRAENQIKAVTRKYYFDSLLRKAFDCLVDNYNYQAEERQVSEYAEQMAEQQDQSQLGTAAIYCDTNALTKTFFAWRNYQRCEKLVRKSLFIMMKSCFCRLNDHNNEANRNQLRVQRFIQRKKKAILFKCFLALQRKASLTLPPRLQSSVQGFIAKRQLQIKEICFAALNLQRKKRLAISKKIQNALLTNSVRRFFALCRCKVNQKYEQQTMEIQAFYVVQRQHGTRFFKCFRHHFSQSLKQRALEVKSAKIQIQRLRTTACTALNEWRRMTVLRRSYALIERKLRRVKENEETLRLLRLWRQRLRQKASTRRGNAHGQWLHSYLGKLYLMEESVL